MLRKTSIAFWCLSFQVSLAAHRVACHSSYEPVVDALSQSNCAGCHYQDDISTALGNFSASSPNNILISLALRKGELQESYINQVLSGERSRASLFPTIIFPSEIKHSELTREESLRSFRNIWERDLGGPLGTSEVALLKRWLECGASLPKEAEAEANKILFRFSNQNGGNKNPIN